mgnify:CR=1 FL=1
MSVCHSVSLSFCPTSCKGLLIRFDYVIHYVKFEYNDNCPTSCKGLLISFDRPFPATSLIAWETETKAEVGGKITSGFVLPMLTTLDGLIIVAVLTAQATEIGASHFFPGGERIKIVHCR